VIAHNADTRQINGHSEWRIEVDNQPCRDRGNSNRGSIDASYHGTGENMHRPMYVRGICYRTVNQAPIRAGNHAVRWRQTYTSGDSYWGWNSNSRLMVEVRTWRRGPCARLAIALRVDGEGLGSCLWQHTRDALVVCSYIWGRGHRDRCTADGALLPAVYAQSTLTCLALWPWRVQEWLP